MYMCSDYVVVEPPLTYVCKKLKIFDLFIITLSGLIVKSNYNFFVKFLIIEKFKFFNP